MKSRKKTSVYRNKNVQFPSRGLQSSPSLIQKNNNNTEIEFLWLRKCIMFSTYLSFLPLSSIGWWFSVYLDISQSLSREPRLVLKEWNMLTAMLRKVVVRTSCMVTCASSSKESHCRCHKISMGSIDLARLGRNSYLCHIYILWIYGWLLRCGRIYLFFNYRKDIKIIQIFFLKKLKFNSLIWMNLILS